MATAILIADVEKKAPERRYSKSIIFRLAFVRRVGSAVGLFFKV